MVQNLVDNARKYAAGSPILITAFLSIELFLMGATFAPMGALLPELFPTSVRYTGAGAAYNLGGILGASLAPYIAQQLVAQGGLSWVGGYISVAAAISLFGFESGAALATVVGVLIEVPVMLSVVAIVNRTEAAYNRATAAR